MTNDSKNNKKLIKSHPNIRNGHLKKVRLRDKKNRHFPLRRINGFRISPSSFSSDDSFHSGIDSSVDFVNLPKETYNYENAKDSHKPKKEFNGCSLLEDLPTTSTSLNFWESRDETIDKTYQDQSEHTPWIRRKYYIVENCGRSSEVFCTDFLHNAKHTPLHKALSDDDRRLLRVVDRWREEWNNGVQVPLSVSRQTYYFEEVTLFPDIELKDYNIPKKLISHNRKVYTSNNPTLFNYTPRSPVYSYLIDEQDENWLLNQSNQTPTFTFIKAMNYFEISAYKNIHNQLLVYLSDNKDSDADAKCEICRLHEWDQDDQIVFCDGCNVSVHQTCYGITSVPPGEWLCAGCEQGKYPQQGCLFCPIKGGAMKPAKHLDTWAHVACALWIPEVRFGDVDKMEPITHVNDIPAERWQNKCSLCDTRTGACIKCTESKCESTFHVSCALRADHVLKIINDPSEVTGVKMVSLCQKHSQNSHYNDRKKPPNKQINRISELTKNFAKFVDLNEASIELNIDHSIIMSIYEYWKSKRTHNGCNPLIVEPADIDLNGAHDGVSSSKKKTFRKRCPLPTPYDLIPFPELKKEYESIRVLRLNLEKARNLCYMNTRREKLKASYYDLIRQNMTKSGTMLENNHLPMSKRRLEKMLSLWSLSVNGNADANCVVNGLASTAEISLELSESCHSASKKYIKTEQIENSDEDDVTYLVITE